MRHMSHMSHPSHSYSFGRLNNTSKEHKAYESCLGNWATSSISSSCVWVSLLRVFAKLRKATLSFIMYVCLSAYNISAPIRRIFVTSDIWGIFDKSVQNFKIRLKNLTIITGNLHEHGPGSSVGIATDYVLDGPGSNPGGDEIFRPSRPALRPTQLPVKWVPVLPRG